LAIVGLAEVVSLILTLLGLVTSIGFLVVGSIIIGMILDAEILSAGVANITCGSNNLSSTDCFVLLVVVLVIVIVQCGLLIKMRQID
jgi:hypothetical protein